MQLVVGVETGRLAQRVGLAPDVLEVVDVLEQPPVPAHRLAHGGGQRPSDGLVGEVARRLEQRHRLPVDHIPVPGGRRTDRLEHLAVGDPAQRVAEGEATGRGDRVGEVERLGVERVGGPQRHRQSQRHVQGRRVAPLRGTIDDVVVHERPEVEQLDRRRAAHRGVAVTRAGQREHQAAPGGGTPNRRSVQSASATGSSNVATTRWIRRSTSASRNASSATRRDVSRTPRLFDRGHTPCADSVGGRGCAAPVHGAGGLNVDVRIHDLLARTALVQPTPHRRDPRRRRCAPSPSSTPARTAPRTGSSPRASRHSIGSCGGVRPRSTRSSSATASRRPARSSRRSTRTSPNPRRRRRWRR